MFTMPASRDVLHGAANTARQQKSQVSNANSSIDTYQKELITFDIQWHKILASSLACVAMFLIGAPLGAIIKKGGLGVPFLVSILFFIIYYVVTMQGEKLAKQAAIPVWVGVWIADVILFAIGLVFLRQARIDARLFDSDFYAVVMEKVKRWLAERKQARMRPA
jgi:lipopolysaccharide export system permease protein